VGDLCENGGRRDACPALEPAQNVVVSSGFRLNAIFLDQEKHFVGQENHFFARENGIVARKHKIIA
jgi:hypothetical protein